MRAKKTGTQVRREQIADAAMSLISEGGLSHLSVAGIAKKVGIVPSAVYRHFDNKDAILEAVFNLLDSNLKANVALVRDESSSALERLRCLLDLHLEMLKSNPTFLHVIFAHFAQPEPICQWNRLKEIMESYLAAIAGVIEEGKQDCVVRADVSPQSAAVLFIGLIIPVAMLYRLSDGKFDTKSQLESIWPVFERGITGAKSR